MESEINQKLSLRFLNFSVISQCVSTNNILPLICNKVRWLRLELFCLFFLSSLLIFSQLFLNWLYQGLFSIFLLEVVQPASNLLPFLLYLLKRLYFCFFELLSVIVFLLFSSKSSIENVWSQITVVNQGNGHISTKFRESEVMHAFVLNDVGNIHTFLFLLLRNWVAIFTNFLW